MQQPTFEFSIKQLLIGTVIGIVVGMITSSAAGRKGRSTTGWFWFGFFLPLIALIAVFLAGSLVEQRRRQAPAEQWHFSPSNYTQVNKVQGVFVEKPSQSRKKEILFTILWLAILIIVFLGVAFLILDKLSK